MSASTPAAPVAAQEIGKPAGRDVSWLSPTDQELLRRSYLRCLRAHYARIGDAPNEAMLAASFDRDLDPFTLLIAREDLKRAPRVLVSRVPHIGCEWFHDGSATAR
jgi:hypothetical protein